MVESNVSNPIFHNEEAAYAYVEERLWPRGAVCPRRLLAYRDSRQLDAVDGVGVEIKSYVRDC